MLKNTLIIHFFYDLNIMLNGHFFVILCAFSAMPLNAMNKWLQTAVKQEF